MPPLLRNPAPGSASTLPIPAPLRRRLERWFDADLSTVRLVTGGRAAAAVRRTGADAIAVGETILVAPGRFDPDSDRGRALLVHELTHVLQQRAGAAGAAVTAAPDDLEAEAGRFARGFLASQPRPSTTVLAAPPGRPQAHFGPDCPGPPQWTLISAKPPEVWLAANKAIENAYRAQYPTGVMYGSDFEPFSFGRYEVAPPRGFPEGDYAGLLLMELRGIRFQTPPDIIDFERRVFYEFKTVTSSTINPGSIREQIKSYYNVTEELYVQHGGFDYRPFQQLFATWYPPHVIPMWSPPGRQRVVCTSMTDYSKWPEGLILYSVLERLRRKRKNKKKIRQVDIKTLAPEMRDLQTDLVKLLIEIPQEVDEEVPYHVIIAPTAFMRTWQNTLQDQRFMEMYRVPLPPFLDPKHPIGQFHRLGWMLVGLTAAAYAALYIGGFLLMGAPGLGAAGAAAAGGAASGGATVIPLAAFRAAATAPAVQEVAKAAGVLIVLGHVADAKAETPKITGASAIRAVAIRDFDLSGKVPAAVTGDDRDDVALLTGEELGKIAIERLPPGRTVSFDGVDHTVIGLVRLVP